MVLLLRHRQTKGAATAGSTLGHRATSLLYRETELYLKFVDLSGIRFDHSVFILERLEDLRI